MTPKEKAKELVDNFYDNLPQWVNADDAKQCAFIAVDEILKTNTDESIYGNQFSIYWNEVKKEIEFL